MRRHRTLGKRDLLLAEPLIREPGLTGGAIYFDAQCDDARLVIAATRAATSHGAKVANYMRVTGLIPTISGIHGAYVRDELSGETGEVRARLVVNAAGPWADAIRRFEDPGAAPLLRPTKGVHVVVPRTRIGNRNAIIFTSPVDGRVMFVLPWGAWAYVGTTDTDSPFGPDAVTVDESDVLYLLRSVNALFPSARLDHADVIASWAGLRPLLAADPSAPASAISREHRIVLGPRGLYTIAGGKLTTWRRMAAELTDRLVKGLGRHEHGRGRALSETEPLPGGETAVLDGFRGPGLELGLSEGTVDHLLGHFGAEVPAIYKLCRERPELASLLHPEHPAIAAEVVFCMQREFVMTADDLLARRLHLTTETRDHGEAARPRVRELLAEGRR